MNDLKRKAQGQTVFAGNPGVFMAATVVDTRAACMW
jgi:hypothetical protein